MVSFDFIRVSIHARFCKALGPPHAMQGDGMQWSFENNLSPTHCRVHIVITGSGPPAVWIFDPSQASEGLEYTQVHNPDQIDPLIQSILNRIKLPIPRPIVPRANAPGRAHHSTDCNSVSSNPANFNRARRLDDIREANIAAANKRVADFRAANHHSNGSATGPPPDQKQASA